MDTDKYKVSFAHFRVPDVAEVLPKPLRGKPEPTMLIQYSRGNSWSDTSSGIHGHLWLHIKPLPTGGRTSCTIISKENGDVLAVGKSLCSLSDNFNYKRGRDIALGRAMAALEPETKGA